VACVWRAGGKGGLLSLWFRIVGLVPLGCMILWDFRMVGDLGDIEEGGHGRAGSKGWGGPGWYCGCMGEGAASGDEKGKERVKGMGYVEGWEGGGTLLRFCRLGAGVVCSRALPMLLVHTGTL
jgi:hypothetical protein